MASISTAMDARHVNARLERLPYTSWHTRMRIIICTAWFFDAFDSLTIAYVLPPLIGMWKLNPPMIGYLIGIGFAGQIVGSIAAGWLAEKIGRVQTLLITLLIFTVMAFACAQATDYDTMCWFRFIQGIGLGGEIPIMAAYVNEFAKAESRAKFSLSIQILFTFGIIAAAASAIYIVPNWGWQWMFYIGAIPALLVIPMRAMLVESPRWLASKGRFDDADRSLKQIEAVAEREVGALPPVPADLPPIVERKPTLGDLFKGIYAKRTIMLWVVWTCAYFCVYGLTVWAPSLFRFVYKLPVEQALTYGFILQVGGLVGAFAALFLLDRIGRKPMFAACLFLSAVPLAVFLFGGPRSPQTVLVLIALSFMFQAVLAIGLATYTAENYPNHMRALGGGVAAAWQRAASMVGPLAVGWVLQPMGLNAVFVMFGIVAVIGALTVLFFANETKGRVLEEVSPPP